MSTRDEEEQRACAYLHERGYLAGRPDWLPKDMDTPDFWAVAQTADPATLWVEVKSIDEEEGSAAIGRFYDTIKACQVPAGLHGHAVMSIEPKAVKQSIERVLKLFAQEAPKFADQKVTLCFAQQMRDKADITRVEVDDTAAPEVVWALGAGSGPICIPIGIDGGSAAPARRFGPGGAEREGRAFEFFDGSTEFECALVVTLDPSRRPIEAINSRAGGTVLARERTVSALTRANKQIKAACAHRNAPGIVMLVPCGRFAADLMVQAACYGQLMVPLTLDDANEPHTGEIFHGRNGVFRPDKNRHISAALHLHPGGTATFFPNPFAHHRIADDAEVFRGAAKTNVNFTGGIER